jgi:hypothetical protein
MDMWVELQALIPSVQHAEESYVGSEMARIASNLQQRLCA